jgi:hypothetical protein
MERESMGWLRVLDPAGRCTLKKIKKLLTADIPWAALKSWQPDA